MKPDVTPTMIDLFAGCGGVTTGFKAKGFNVLAAVEFDPVTAQTYHLNHPEVALYVQDIRDISPNEMMARCRLERGHLTVLSVCAPCQPFSKQNRYRHADERASLILETVRFVEAFHPLFLFIENVPGLRQHSDILDTLVGDLEKLGYTMSEPAIVDAVKYGVPQFRRRFILLGTCLDRALRIPEETHASPHEAVRLGKQEWLTVKDAFAGLQSLHAGEQSATDPLHKARKHTPLSLERLKHIPHNGGSRDSLPIELQLSCHRNGRHGGYHDVYGRLDFERPANTLTTGCTNVTKGRFAHPTSDRAITPREAARLQTFPDTYRFYGSYEKISAQIGNAVPVKLAEIFAQYFHELWEKLSQRTG
ncbi:DNA cytosine methyltransferase [Chloroflexus aggregans]|uniref:DNA (cytosine-5-)-methyltransferase n=1 Tax=Chloroflexus aggregans (strain MD-66 / DSM 9485) TaxID=326427 RepID=B8G8M2_CHLAD|nr:DNA cytosine methyltransferase [Chloroflexus aggregans]ACL24284.1 DNA-cytosine methyltransferase [Chloroflexus aggregans DSM 9485]